jgi:alpha-tubulin suppressor-like RCC1 family protein
MISVFALAYPPNGHDRLVTPCLGATLAANMFLSACNRPTSPKVFPPLIYTSITVGGEHSCATIASGVTLCWGRNTEGQLGIGTNTANWSLPQVVQAPAGIGFRVVAAGGFHSCALTPVGVAYCWGDNQFNQVGDGTNEVRMTPVVVSAPTGVKFRALTAGFWHSCALTTAEAAYCWGSNLDGALGDGTTTTPRTPTSVATPAGVTFAAVTAGGNHTCGVTAMGVAYCWGENTYGGLGDGTTQQRTTPVLVQAPPGVAFVAVSAGGEHTCGLTARGAAYCWGLNGQGQLGDGTTTNRPTPVVVTAQPEISFVTVDAGGFRTCGVAASGATYCWGRGVFVNGIDRTTPVVVTTPAGVTFATVGVGSWQICALTALGAAYCGVGNTLIRLP